MPKIYNCLNAVFHNFTDLIVPCFSQQTIVNSTSYFMRYLASMILKDLLSCLLSSKAWPLSQKVSLVSGVESSKRSVKGYLAVLQLSSFIQLKQFSAAFL